MRHIKTTFNNFLISFNPRICKRCDTIKLLHGLIKKCFNPRICKRCDFCNPLERKKWAVSIHASVKDATNLQEEQYLAVEFQSTHL